MNLDMTDNRMKVRVSGGRLFLDVGHEQTQHFTLIKGWILYIRGFGVSAFSHFSLLLSYSILHLPKVVCFLSSTGSNS